MIKFNRVYDKNKDKRTEYIGVYVQRETVSLLNLYCLCTGETRTKILRKSLTGYLLKIGICETELFHKIGDQIQTMWVDEVWTNPEADFEKFLDVIKKQLIKKKISPYYISEIVKRIKPR